MKVTKLTSKGSGRVNEDCLFIKDNLFGVFDGLTSLNKYTDIKGNSGGQIASQLIKKIFEEKYSQDFLWILHKARIELNREMIKRKFDLSQKVNRLSTTIAVVRLISKHIEFVQVGDSPIVLINKDKSFRVIMSSKNTDKKSLILWKRLSIKETINWSENKEIMDQLIKVRQMANVTYGTFNGEVGVFNFILNGKISINNITDILLFTDGLFWPVENPSKEENIDDLVNLYLNFGLKKLKEKVRQQEADDPLCKRYPRFKKHDDIAAISIKIS